MLQSHPSHYSQEGLRVNQAGQGYPPPTHPLQLLCNSCFLGGQLALALEADPCRAKSPDWRQDLVSILPFLLICCVTLGELLKLSDPWCPLGVISTHPIYLKNDPVDQMREGLYEKVICKLQYQLLCYYHHKQNKALGSYKSTRSSCQLTRVWG